MNDLKPRRDKLTILRLLLLTAGVAVGLRMFQWQLRRWDPSSDADWWRWMAAAILAGCSLPGPLFAIARRRSGARLKTGGILWLTLGLGAWMLLPAVLVDRYRLGLTALYYCLPLTALWTTLAAAAAGRLNRRSLGRDAPWFERFGLYLGLAWSPLGIWHIVVFYWVPFFR